MSRPRRGCWRARGSTPAALRMRRALADPSAGGAGAGARRRHARGAAQQLLGQACGLSVRGLRARRRPRAATSSRRIRCSARCKAALEELDRRGARARTSAPSTAARCRPGRCRSRRWRGRFARFGTGVGLAPERAKAAARLRAACAAHPWHVAGTGRFCTEIMQRFGAARVREDRRRGRLLRARCPSRASASRSNATTAAAAPPKSRWRRRWRASCR